MDIMYKRDGVSMLQDEIKKLYIAAVEMKLSGAALLLIDKAATWCNGLGAEWMPGALRDLLSVLNPTLDPVVAIHDIRYELGGTEQDRDFADNEFKENGIKAAEYTYGWYNPLRYHVRHQAKKYHLLLTMFGAPAFNYKKEETEC